MIIPTQYKLIGGVVAFVGVISASVLFTHHVDNLAFDKYKDSIKIQSAAVQQKAEDHVVQAATQQADDKVAIVAELTKTVAQQKEQITKNEQKLHDSNAALGIAISSLFKLANSGSNTTGQSSTVSDGTTDARSITDQLDRADAEELAIAQQGANAVASYKACYDQYQSAFNAVNGVK